MVYFTEGHRYQCSCLLCNRQLTVFIKSCEYSVVCIIVNCRNILVRIFAKVFLSIIMTCYHNYSTNQYMGFGLSGSDSATVMVGADPTIAWVDPLDGPQAVDYYLSAYTQVGINNTMHAT